MTYVMNMDSPSIRRIERRISEVEVAIKHAKKTTRVHQTNKKMSKLNGELKRAIYHHNKFDMFNFIEKEMDKQLAELHASGKTLAFRGLYE